MPLALLIGFKYKTHPLPGMSHDIDCAHDWCSSFFCDSHIITDNVDYHRGNTYTVTNSKEFIDCVKTILESYPIPDNKLIIYYTGHGKDNSLIMPDESLLQFVTFRDNIISNIGSQVEIFCILDCCNPNGMHLPYKLVNNEFVLSSSKVECIEHPMLLITSSESYEKSVALKTGSIFSSNLFRILSALKNRNLQRLLDSLSNNIKSVKTGYSQTVSIYSSYIYDPVLWTWIGNSNNYDIVSDMSLSTLVIRVSDTYYNPYDGLYTY